MKKQKKYKNINLIRKINEINDDNNIKILENKLKNGDDKENEKQEIINRLAILQNIKEKMK